MSANELLKQVYAQFYEQRDVLTDGPQLSQGPNDSPFDTTKAEKELAGVVSYLMGVPDIQTESFEHIIEIIETHYASQPEWKNLLLNYFEYQTEKEKESLEAQEDALIQELKEFTKSLLEKKD